MDGFDPYNCLICTGWRFFIALFCFRQSHYWIHPAVFLFIFRKNPLNPLILKMPCAKTSEKFFILVYRVFYEKRNTKRGGKLYG